MQTTHSYKAQSWPHINNFNNYNKVCCQTQKTKVGDKQSIKTWHTHTCIRNDEICFKFKKNMNENHNWYQPLNNYRFCTTLWKRIFPYTDNSKLTTFNDFRKHGKKLRLRSRIK